MLKPDWMLSDGLTLEGTLRICTDHFYPELIVQLTGLMKACPEPSV